MNKNRKIELKWKTNLFTSLNILHSNKLISVLVPHEPSHPKIPRPNITDQLIPITVMHDWHIHSWPNSHRRTIHLHPFKNPTFCFFYHYAPKTTTPQLQNLKSHIEISTTQIRSLKNTTRVVADKIKQGKAATT